MSLPLPPPVLAQLDAAALWVALAASIVVIFFGLVVTLARRYKRCPSNRVLVVYGRSKSGKVAKTMHGGGTLVLPLIQDYAFLSLDPIQIEVPLENALSMENIRISVPSVFTVAIGTEPSIMNNAAIRLLGLTTKDISKQAEDIIFGQLRQVIASMLIEDINRDREQFLQSIQNSLEPELAKIGLVLINVNIKDLTDESGYIEAIGRKAAAQAIQQALIDVSEQEKLGAIGVASADRERAIQVANAEKLRSIGTSEAERERAVRIAELERERTVGEKQAAFQRDADIKDAEREMRVRTSEANAKAVEGENLNKARVVQAEAELRIREAEAYQAAETRKREADAAVREAQYLAEARAAEAEAKKREAEKRAELESLAKAEKAQTIVDAEAEAARVTLAARAEADAIYAKLEAEARGNFEILAKKGEGLKRIVESCGGAQGAFQMLLLEHIESLSANAAKAISNIKFDKIVVWDGAQGADGKGSTSRFLHSLGGSIPPVLQMMRDIGGVEMPEFFGRILEDPETARQVEETLEKRRKAEAEKNPPPAASKPTPPKPDGSKG
ncbi:MAG: flotillin family protein [Planctomycetaceae bacterium]|nr:flotillin family protein [Planctomycetaceae bacterium]